MRSRVFIAVYFWFAADLVRRALLLSLLILPVIAAARLAQVYGAIDAHTFGILAFAIAAATIAVAVHRFSDFTAACRRIDSYCSTDELFLSVFFGNRSSRFYTALIDRASTATRKILLGAGKALVFPALFVSGGLLVTAEMGTAPLTPSEKAADPAMKNAEDVEVAIQKSGKAGELAENLSGLKSARISGDRQKLWQELLRLSSRIESMRGTGNLSIQAYSDMKTAIRRAAGAIAGKSDVSGIFSSSLAVRNQEQAIARLAAKNSVSSSPIVEMKTEFVSYKDARTTGVIGRYFEEVQR